MTKHKARTNRNVMVIAEAGDYEIDDVLLFKM